MKDSRGARVELGRGVKCLEGQVAVFRVHPICRTLCFSLYLEQVSHAKCHLKKLGLAVVFGMECLLMVQSGGSFPDVQNDAINLAETAGTEWKWVHLHTSAKKE